MFIFHERLIWVASVWCWIWQRGNFSHLTHYWHFTLVFIWPFSIYVKGEEVLDWWVNLTCCIEVDMNAKGVVLWHYSVAIDVKKLLVFLACVCVMDDWLRSCQFALISTYLWLHLVEMMLWLLRRWILEMLSWLEMIFLQVVGVLL